MSAAKHTPGPWKREAKTGRNRFRITDARGHQVADTNTYNEDAEANADVIAAAPELLEALQELVDGMTDVEDSESCVLFRARAAIAKATGSTS